MAHINISELLNIMPEFIVHQINMEKIYNTSQNNLNDLDAKLSAKMKKYQEEASSQTQEVNEQRQLEVQQDQEALYNKIKLQAEFSNLMEEKGGLIFEKATFYVLLVAREQGYEYVLDSSFYKLPTNGKDLYEDVKIKMGI